MKKSKLLFGTTLLLMTSILATACGGSATTPSQSGKKPAGEASVKPGGDPVKLTMYSWRPEDKAGYEALIGEFQKQNPDIKVEFKPFKSTEYNTILNNTLVSGSGVDILQLRPYDVATTLADGKYLTALDKVKGVDQIPDSYLAAAKGSDNKVYGIPFMLNNAVIFYNKKMFEEQGLKTPETFEEFLAVCEKLKSKNIVPIAQSGKAAYLLSMTHSVIGESAYGGNAFVDSLLKGKSNFKDPGFVESISRMKKLEPYFPKDFIAIDDKDAQTLFYNGQAAMYINGSHRLETFEANKLDFPVDFFTGFVAKKGDQPNIVTWVDGSYAVAKDSKYQEQSLKFMEFIASKTFGQMFSEKLTRVSPITGVEPTHPLLKKMASISSKNSTPYLILTNFNLGTPPTKVTFEDSLQGMYLGRLTPEQVAEAVQTSSGKWFKAQP
ncbi:MULTISPECIES: ABC transporter substrate-binding protein [unclassified Paenibacillus]|uniref:ABC transporter substrate-binding protein n=1 Tax=unclassified Paenibacillus TaxID=185978 RepID=UPI0036343447